MEVRELKEKLCRGVSSSDDSDEILKVEKVLAPFMRTLKKRKHEKADAYPAIHQELYLKRNPKELLTLLQSAFTDALKLKTLMNETAELLKVVTKSKSVNLYLTDYDVGEIVLCPKYYTENPRFEKRYPIGTYVAAHVASTKEYVISSDILGDIRFPQGIPEVPVVKSVICLPIITNVEENCIGVIELYRECSEKPYDLVNLQICNALTAWMGIALEENKGKLNLVKEIEIQEQLSRLADLYFSGIIPFSTFVSDTVKMTKAAVNAEKGAFYVFHKPVPFFTEDVLTADVYEEGTDDSKETFLYKKNNRIRFVNCQPGIAGYAARTAEVINIRDAYKDYRFDRKNESFYYRTRSVMALPIKNENGVLAVLKLINCLNYPYFREEDVDIVQSFLCYISLICGYFLLDKEYSKKELKLVVTEKLLDFHTKPTPEDVNAIKFFVQGDSQLPLGFCKTSCFSNHTFIIDHPLMMPAVEEVGETSGKRRKTTTRRNSPEMKKEDLTINSRESFPSSIDIFLLELMRIKFFALDSFDWDQTHHEEESLKYIAHVFLCSDIFEPFFEVLNLSDFLLRVKKCYRPLFYHNFIHAFGVFHFVFNIILRNKNVYSASEVVTVLLTALCHDIDHSGLTNTFLSLTNDNIYKLYGDFCGEAHRYEFVMFLIQQTDLLANASETTFQHITKNLKKLMMGFNLALHFQSRQEIINLLNSDSFDWENPQHRLLSLNMILMCSEHCASYKSFDIVKKRTSMFYKELYKQGDMEKSMGFSPLPMLDRNKIDMNPENQTILLTIVVLPATEILTRLFPNLSVLEENLSVTLSKWNELLQSRGLEMWRINEALAKDRRGTHKITLSNTLSSIKTVISQETRSLKF